MNQKLLTGAVAAMAFLLPSTAMGQTADFNIIPQPQQVVADASAPFVLNTNAVIYVQTNSQDMKRNANMLATYIQQATGIRPAIGKQPKGGTAIILSIDKTISNAEGYRLNSDAKQIRIAGASAAGVFYGIQTLRKSLPLCNGKATQVSIPLFTSPTRHASPIAEPTSTCRATSLPPTQYASLSTCSPCTTSTASTGISPTTRDGASR